MNITRITKDNYQISCCKELFTVNKTADLKHWIVRSDELKVYHVADDLSEAIDFIDFIMLIS